MKNDHITAGKIIQHACVFQILPIQHLAVAEYVCDGFPFQRFHRKGKLIHFFRTGCHRKRQIIRCGTNQKRSYLHPFPAVSLIIQHIAEELIIVLIHTGLHRKKLFQIHILSDQRTICFYIIVNRKKQRCDTGAVKNVFQIEDKILTEADGGIQADRILIQNRLAVQLVPENTVIVIRRRLLHVFRVFFPGQHPICRNTAFAGKILSDHPVKLSDHKIGILFLCRTHQHFGGVFCDPVICIQKLQEGSLRLIDSPVAGITDSGIWFVNDFYPFIVCGKAIQQLSRTVL